MVIGGHWPNADASVAVSTDRPIFSDDSGVRAAVLRWGIWAICAMTVMVGGALVLTLRTHVAVPGVHQLLPSSRGEIEREAGLPTEELSSQPVQPSMTLRPSGTFQPGPTAGPSRSARLSPTATSANALPSPAVKRAAPTAGARSAAPRGTSTTTAQARPSDQGTTKDRNSHAAAPSPPESRATSRPGNGRG